MHAVHGHRSYDVWDSHGLAQDTCALSSSYYLSMTKKRQLPASELDEADDFYSDPHQDSAPTKLKTDGDLPVPLDRQESLSSLRSVSGWNQKVHQTSLCKPSISWSQRQDRGSSSRNVGRQAKRKQARDAIVLACMKDDPALERSVFDDPRAYLDDKRWHITCAPPQHGDEDFISTETRSVCRRQDRGLRFHCWQ